MVEHARKLVILASALTACAPQVQSSEEPVKYGYYDKCKTSDGKDGYEVTIIYQSGRSTAKPCRTFSPPK